MDVGSIVITIAAILAIGWLAFLVAANVRGRGATEVAPNLAPFLSDDELENQRLDRVQAAAVAVIAFLALSIPVYFLGEADRQAGFEEEFHEQSIERGEHLVEEFGCGNCHGAALDGGVASFTEARSGVSVAWAAPALNDIFYRYDREETRFWLVYGRSNTPMPAWGLAGGGPMNDQQIDDILNYLETIQLPQVDPEGPDAVEAAQARIDQALTAYDNADQAVQTAIADQQALIERMRLAPDLAPKARDLLRRLNALLEQADVGVDADGDGLSDVAEANISDLSKEAQATLAPVTSTPLDITLDPRNPRSNGIDDDPQAVARLRGALETLVTQLTVTAQNLDKLLETAEGGLAFLERAAEERRWEVDFEGVAENLAAVAAEEGLDIPTDVDAARRAVGIFNGTCARCHTAGYSAGLPFSDEIGSGALGPALWKGRAKVQFNTFEDMLSFIEKGSELAKPYGVNGMGRGWMPGFGTTLPLDDLELLVAYLRTDDLRGR